MFSKATLLHHDQTLNYNNKIKLINLTENQYTKFPHSPVYTHFRNICYFILHLSFHCFIPQFILSYNKSIHFTFLHYSLQFILKTMCHIFLLNWCLSCKYNYRMCQK